MLVGTFEAVPLVPLCCGTFDFWINFTEEAGCEDVAELVTVPEDPSTCGHGASAGECKVRMQVVVQWLRVFPLVSATEFKKRVGAEVFLWSRRPISLSLHAITGKRTSYSPAETNEMQQNKMKENETGKCSKQRRMRQTIKTHRR
jgi:hypothetical protein